MINEGKDNSAFFVCYIVNIWLRHRRALSRKPKPPEHCHDARTLLFYRLPGCLPCQMQRDLFLAFEGVANES